MYAGKQDLSFDGERVRPLLHSRSAEKRGKLDNGFRSVDRSLHRAPTSRAEAVDCAHLNAGVAHWDEYEQRRQRVSIMQFVREYGQRQLQFDQIKQSLLPVSPSRDYLSKKDELKAIEVSQQREAEFRQQLVFEWLRQQQRTEEVHRVLQKQLQEQRNTQQYHAGLEKAYAKQIEYRVEKSREIDRSRYLHDIETKRNYQSALRTQIAEKQHPRRDLRKLIAAERLELNKASGVFQVNAAKVLLS